MILIGILSLFFFLFTFVPTSYSAIRVAALAAVIVLYTWNCSFKLKIVKSSTVIIVLYVMYSLFEAAWGFVNGGDVAAIRTNVVYPLLFFFVFSLIVEYISISTLTTILLWCAFFVSASDLWVAFYSLGMVPIYPGILYSIDLGYIFNAGYASYFQYTSTHMVSHFFLAPLATSLVLFNLHHKRFKIFPVIVMLMQWMCIYFSGRAALILSYVVVAFLILIFDFIYAYKKGQIFYANKIVIIRFIILMSIAVCALLSLVLMHIINIGGVYEYVLLKLNGVYSSGTSILDTRSSQRIEYMAGWLQSPIIGHGMGTGTPYIRNGIWVDDKAIELTYVSMLYQTGVLGVIFFFSMIAYTVTKILKGVFENIIDYCDGMPYLYGMIAILLGAGSNPYIFTMGCMWMVYLPLAIASKKEYMRFE